MRFERVFSTPNRICYTRDMKSLFAALVIVVAGFLPAIASADVWPTRSQMLSREAALFAMDMGRSVACKVATDVARVRVGQPFALFWGSYGAEDLSPLSASSRFAPIGDISIVLDRPGTYQYIIGVSSRDGFRAECSTSIVVTQ